MRALMRFIDEMPAAAVRVPTFNLAFLPRFAAMSEEEFRAFAESKPLRKEFMLAMGRTGFPEKEMNAALERMRRTYERMDLEIAASGGPWLMGKDITLADVAVMPAIVRMADLGLDFHVEGHAAHRALVRPNSRAPRVQADLLFRLAAHRALSASNGEGGRGLNRSRPLGFIRRHCGARRQARARNQTRGRRLWLSGLRPAPQ